MYLSFAGNGNKDGLFTVLLRDYGSEAAAVCMNRLAKLRCWRTQDSDLLSRVSC